MDGTLSGVLRDRSTLRLWYCGMGLLCGGDTVGRMYFEKRVFGGGVLWGWVQCGGTTEGRGILWAGGSLRRGYFAVELLWGIIVLSGVLWCGVYRLLP
jgi:hypothetical protein